MESKWTQGLQVDEFQVNHINKHSRFRNGEPYPEELYGHYLFIKWSGAIGFGEYTLTCKDGKIYGDSEHMDKGDDKSFLRALLNDLVDRVEVVG